MGYRHVEFRNAKESQSRCNGGSATGVSAEPVQLYRTKLLVPFSVLIHTNPQRAGAVAAGSKHRRYFVLGAARTPALTAFSIRRES